MPSYAKYWRNTVLTGAHKMNEKMLNDILSDLNQHKREKQEVMKYAINDRINKSISIYYRELSESITRLNAKKSERVLKELNKL